MDHKQYFDYGEKELAFLKAKDPVLGKAMDDIGHIRRQVMPDLFLALLNAIVGQQISTKAQATVWGRLRSNFAPMTPENIHALPAAEIQACGLTMKKAVYIKEIAASIVAGALELNELRTLDDVAVCARLSQIRGIGVWTAEMLLIFALQRPDVLSREDLGIQRGLRMLYGHRKITRELFAKYKKRYSPHATVASLYLWEISHGTCAGLVDPAPKAAPRKTGVPRKRGTGTTPRQPAAPEPQPGGQ